MLDAVELSLHVGGGYDIAVGKMPKVELDAGLQAPIERHLVDGDCTLAAVHGGSKMPGSIEMGGVVSGQPDPFDRPGLAIGQILFAQAGKKLDDIADGLPVG